MSKPQKKQKTDRSVTGQFVTQSHKTEKGNYTKIINRPVNDTNSVSPQFVRAPSPQTKSIKADLALKKDRFDLRLPSEIKERIEHAAELQGRSTSEFVVSAALMQANQVIEQNKVIKLCIEDSKALAEAFMNEPEPNAKTMEAVRRYKEKMGRS